MISYICILNSLLPLYILISLLVVLFSLSRLEKRLKEFLQIQSSSSSSSITRFKNPKKMESAKDHKAPKEHPKDMACWHPIEPMAFLSRSNATDSPDPGAGLCRVPGNCRRRDRAGSTYDPPEQCSRRKQAKTAAAIPARRFSSSSEAPSIPQSSLYNLLLSTALNQSP